MTPMEKASAMNILFPNGGFSLKGTNIIMDNGLTEPTAQELADALVQANLLTYRSLRAAAYPPIGDQLDALWKGGQAAADMLVLVQAVKQAYPKPEGV